MLLLQKNGKNIYPEEIEGLLIKNEYIKECMVYGKQNKDDIKLAAELVLEDDYIKEKFKDNPKTEEEIKALVWEDVKKINEQLVTYKHIKRN